MKKCLYLLKFGHSLWGHIHFEKPNTNSMISYMLYCSAEDF